MQIKNSIFFLIILISSLLNSSYSENLSDKFVNIHGFISQGFFASRNYNFLAESSRSGSWEMREVGINFQKELGNRFRIGTQFLSRDVGVFGNNKIILDWAYGNVFINDALNISVGRLKNQLGFYSEIQDFDFLTPWASLPYYIYDKGLRTITSSTDGVKILGNIRLGRLGDLSYSLTLGTTDVGIQSDIEEYGKSIKETFLNNSVKTIIIPQIMYNTPIDGLVLNFACYNAFNFNYTVNKNISGSQTDVEISQNINWFYTGIKYQNQYIDLVTEYHHQFMSGNQHIVLFNIDNPDTTRRVGGYAGFNVKPLDWFNVGGYMQLHWRDIFNIEKQDSPNDPSRVQHDGALTLTFKAKDILVIKLEGHQVYGTAMLSKDINEDVIDSKNHFTNGDTWQYVIIKVTYNF